MGRLIDADKLDEEVMHLFIEITGKQKQSIVVDECKKTFRNMIDEQPTVELTETAKWIPCSERLPEESGKYEVTALDAGRLIVTQAKWKPKMKSWNLTGAMAYWKIIAWKPIQEPYHQNKCHGCFGAANNDCERCMDGNEK